MAHFLIDYANRLNLPFTKSIIANCNVYLFSRIEFDEHSPVAFLLYRNLHYMIHGCPKF